MQIRLEEYVRVGGSCPYQEWFDGLDALAAAKVAVAKVRMELGNTSNIKWFRGIGEYLIDWGPVSHLSGQRGRCADYFVGRQHQARPTKGH